MQGSVPTFPNFHGINTDNFEDENPGKNYENFKKNQNSQNYRQVGTDGPQQVSLTRF